MVRKVWLNVYNGAFDESNRLLFTEAPNRATGSSKWANNFYCSKCADHYFVPNALQRHVKKCAFRFSNSVNTQGPKGVWCVDGKSAVKEKRVCEKLSSWMVGNYWSFPLVQPGNWNYPGPDAFNSHVFVLTLNNQIVSHLAFRERLTTSSKMAREYHWLDKNSKGIPSSADWALAQIFTVEAERSKGHANSLLNEALKYKAINLTDVAFVPPIYPDGEKFIDSLGLSKVKIAK